MNATERAQFAYKAVFDAVRSANPGMTSKDVQTTTWEAILALHVWPVGMLGDKHRAAHPEEFADVCDVHNNHHVTPHRGCVLR